jgi:hypothetical protein
MLLVLPNQQRVRNRLKSDWNRYFWLLHVRPALLASASQDAYQALRDYLNGLLHPSLAD